MQSFPFTPIRINTSGKTCGQQEALLSTLNAPKFIEHVKIFGQPHVEPSISNKHFVWLRNKKQKSIESHVSNFAKDAHEKTFRATANPISLIDPSKISEQPDLNREPQRLAPLGPENNLEIAAIYEQNSMLVDALLRREHIDEDLLHALQEKISRFEKESEKKNDPSNISGQPDLIKAEIDSEDWEKATTSVENTDAHVNNEFESDWGTINPDEYRREQLSEPYPAAIGLQSNELQAQIPLPDPYAPISPKDPHYETVLAPTTDFIPEHMVFSTNDYLLKNQRIAEDALEFLRTNGKTTDLLFQRILQNCQNDEQFATVMRNINEGARREIIEAHGFPTKIAGTDKAFIIPSIPQGYNPNKNNHKASCGFDIEDFIKHVYGNHRDNLPNVLKLKEDKFNSELLNRILLKCQPTSFAAMMEKLRLCDHGKFPVTINSESVIDRDQLILQIKSVLGDDVTVNPGAFGEIMTARGYVQYRPFPLFDNCEVSVTGELYNLGIMLKDFSSKHLAREVCFSGGSGDVCRIKASMVKSGELKRFICVLFEFLKENPKLAKNVAVGLKYTKGKGFSFARDGKVFSEACMRNITRGSLYIDTRETEVLEKLNELLQLKQFENIKFEPRMEYNVASVCDAMVCLLALGIKHGEITDYEHGFKLYSVDYDGSFDFEIIRACFLEGDIAHMKYMPLETNSGKKVFHKVRLSLVADNIRTLLPEMKVGPEKPSIENHFINDGRLIEPLEVLREMKNASKEKSIRVTEHNVLEVKDTYICKDFGKEKQKLLEENPHFNKNCVEETALKIEIPRRSESQLQEKTSLTFTIRLKRGKNPLKQVLESNGFTRSAIVALEDEFFEESETCTGCVKCGRSKVPKIEAKRKVKRKRKRNKRKKQRST